MKRISSELEERVIDLWIDGHSRDQIAKTLHISGSTVSSIVSSLPKNLEILRDLRLELRKINLLPTDSLEGARLISEIRQLGVEPNQVRISIQAVKKIAEDSGYQPKQVIQAEMKLSRLEQESGKPYSEAIKGFEANAQLNKNLKQDNLRLQLEIGQNKLERKQTLKKARIAEKEITYVKELKSEFRCYGVDLEDAESLRKYLGNMKETRCNPKRFMCFTKKHGSINGRLSYLKAEVQKESINLSEAAKRVESKKNELINFQIAHKNFIKSACEERDAIRNDQYIEQTTLDQLTAKRQAADNNLRITQTATKDEENKRQNTIRETETILGIKNLAIGYQDAIARLQNEKARLDNEIARKSDRIALADVMTNFLTRQNPIEFNMLC
jgi:hypothetical protein